MLVFMLIVIVLMGFAYADYCLVDNTEHFGISFRKVEETERMRQALRTEESNEAEDESEMSEVPKAARADDEPEVLPLAARERFATGSKAINRAPVRPPRVPAPPWHLRDLEPVLELRE